MEVLVPDDVSRRTADPAGTPAGDGRRTIPSGEDPRGVDVAPLAEVDLVRRAMAGDRDAFDRLARLHVPRLVGTARRLLRDLGEAEEAAADALVRAHAGLARLARPEAFGPWAHQVVLRVALDRLRTRRGVAAARRVEWFDDAGAGGRPVADRVNDRESIDRVRVAVDALPEVQRTALVLHLWEGLSYRDVATLLGCSYDAVRVAVAHARRALRHRLADLVEDAP